MRRGRSPSPKRESPYLRANKMKKIDRAGKHNFNSLSS
jgi:hypothetical protein